ncbi:hypothetical protein HPB47_003111 [Ixodes persulcatus]|uniref:Uncharacterized protein n=1 Tax=Ixodes persulcatus TaxID=34615 RepID=A0AC60PKV7_IXOPE|nr:hypothetical protein HPB47_003111 [Ixodes persulcatus]
MGSGNRAMWKEFGIIAGRYHKVSSSTPHPDDPSKRMFLLADELLAHDKKEVFKLASHLTNMHMTQGHFDKMKISNAVDLMSHRTACAIEELVREGENSLQALTTARFLKMVNRGFDLMCSRHPGMALSLIRPEKHDEAVAFLEFFVDLFLRRVAVLKTPAHTSYSIDDGAFFLADYRTSTPQEVRELVEGTGKINPEEGLVMPSTEKSAFLHLAGYLAAEVLKNNVTCGCGRSRHAIGEQALMHRVLQITEPLTELSPVIGGDTSSRHKPGSATSLLPTPLPRLQRQLNQDSVTRLPGTSR